MNRFYTVSLLHLIALCSLCVSIQITPRLGNQTSADKSTITPEASRPQSCGVCGVGGPNVDVYYWPQSSANTSCLSIIGPTPSPPLAGATTANGVTYWGYTNTDAPHLVVQTMLLTSINGITFKMPLVDPWPDTDTIDTPGRYTLQEPIGRRAYSTPTPIPVAPRAPFNESRGSLLGNISFPAGSDAFVESTVVYNGHTLTSPSIYVDFYSLTATDLCGTLGGGRDGVITSTLIAFAPGELSTFAAPLNEWLFGMQPGLTSSIVPYNFADLPCPPYETMTDQWYKPEPGEPYRPIIAFPTKVLGIDPLWGTCTPAFFTGLDPPTVLHPATALVPQITPAADANRQHVEAKPSPSHHNSPENTARPPVQQVPPARNTAGPSPPINSPSQNEGKSKPDPAVDLGTSAGTSDSNDPKDHSETDNGETINRPESEAASPTARKASQTQPTTQVGNDDLTKNSSPKGDKNSQADPQNQEISNGDNDPSSHPTGAISPNEDDPQQPQPTASAGGEPIIAVPPEASTAQDLHSGTGANGGQDEKDSNGSSDDEQDTEIPNVLKDPANLEPQSSDAPSNQDPIIAPAPFTTTIGRHVIQALPSPNAILVDGKPLTRGQSAVAISGTPIALQQDGNLRLGSSTAANLLPYLSRSGPTADQASPNQAPAPTPPPQVSSIVHARTTGGEAPVFVTGTRIQAFGETRSVSFGDETVRASAELAAVGSSGGARYSFGEGQSVKNTSGGAGVDGSVGLGSAGSAGVVLFRGGGVGRGGVRWGLLFGLVLIGMMR